MAISESAREQHEIRNEKLDEYQERLETEDFMKAGAASSFLKLHAFDFATALVIRTHLKWSDVATAFEELAERARENSTE